MFIWCGDSDTAESTECPVLGEGIRTNDPTLCANTSFWREVSCQSWKVGESEEKEELGYVRCQAGYSGQCAGKFFWGVEGFSKSCSDGSDLYRPIKQSAETEEPSSQASQGDSNEHSSDDGEERINSGGNDNFAEEEKKLPAMGAADKRNSAEGNGGQHSQTQMWNTLPKTEEIYNRDYKGKEEGAKYMKDARTGLWMVAVSEESCKASQGFVCKVRF